MKRILILVTSLVFFSFCCAAQYTKSAFLDSLKNTVYLKDYFKNNYEYNDSCYAEYLNSILPLDTFEIDSNGGFGYNPTSIAISYNKDSVYLNFYCGLSITKGKNKKLRELSFLNCNGHKTALSWTFYKNRKIEKITYYKPELPNKIETYTKIFSVEPTYTFKKFKKHGTLELTGEFKNGKKDGEWFYYDSKGILFKKEKFSDDKRISKVSF